MDHSYDVYMRWKMLAIPSTQEAINELKKTAFLLSREPGRLNSLRSETSVSYYDRIGHELRASSWIDYTNKFAMTLERRVIVWHDTGYGIFCFVFTPRAKDSSSVLWLLEMQMIQETDIQLSPYPVCLAEILPSARRQSMLIGGDTTSVEAGLFLKNYLCDTEHEDNIDSVFPEGIRTILLKFAGQEATLSSDELILHNVPEISDSEVHGWCKGIAQIFLDILAPTLAKNNE